MDGICKDYYCYTTVSLVMLGLSLLSLSFSNETASYPSTYSIFFLYSNCKSMSMFKISEVSLKSNWYDFEFEILPSGISQVCFELRPVSWSKWDEKLEDWAILPKYFLSSRSLRAFILSDCILFTSDKSCYYYPDFPIPCSFLSTH